MSKKNNYVFLESPIEKDEDDIFGVSPYVEQLYAAFSSGAKFVAIDGKFGSGKSSIVNLFQNRVNKNRNVISKNLYGLFNYILGRGKTYFVNINFLNINQGENSNLNNEMQVTMQKNNGDKAVINSLDVTNNNTSIVDSYHRYFVNQVANDLYKNPYDIEKLFYNNFISYATVKKPRNIIVRFVVDKLLLILISIVAVMLMYLTISDSLKKYYGISCFINKYLPILLFLIFVLALIYGYGFYKPEKQDKSPMLDIDKSRNSLCKILYDIIPKNSTIYFVIDDLDRIDNELQRQIISLLYNEYYPLNKVINGIKLKFIFMIDLNSIGEDKEKEINPDKLFDYIVTVSNNQGYVLHGYVEKQIKDNIVLKEIFNGLKCKDYIVGLIVENYPTIRKIKHLFNRIITKYMYFFKKDVPLNNEQLIMICILSGMMDSTKLSNVINCALNDKDIEKDVDKKIIKIINHSLRNNIIDNTYYIYLYNFMDSADILNEAEQFIYNELHNELGMFEEDWLTVYKVLDSLSGNYSNVYNHIYKYLPNNDKILLLGNINFYNYILLTYGIDDLDMKDIYQIPYIYLAFPNIKNFVLYKFKNENISTLESYYNRHIESSYDSGLRKKFEAEFILFINNMDYSIKYFDLKKYINEINVDKNIFDMLISCKYENEPVFFDMILENKLEWTKFLSFIDANFLDEIKKVKDYSKKNNVFKSLLSKGISMSLKSDILVNMDDKYENCEKIYREFINNSSFELSFDNLLNILEKQGYNHLLDKYINKFIGNSEYTKKIIDFINEHEFHLSTDVLSAIDRIPSKFTFRSFYEKLFIEKEYYKLLIYSRLLSCKKLDLDDSLTSESKYIDSIKSVYLDMSNAFKGFDFTVNFSKCILDLFDFNKISFNPLNFWKIDILIPCLEITDNFHKIVDRLVACNVLNDYINYYKNEFKSYDLKFLNYLYNYANEKGLEPSLKANITKVINLTNDRKDV